MTESQCKSTFSETKTSSSNITGPVAFWPGTSSTPMYVFTPGKRNASPKSTLLYKTQRTHTTSLNTKPFRQLSFQTSSFRYTQFQDQYIDVFSWEKRGDFNSHLICSSRERHCALTDRKIQF